MARHISTKSNFGSSDNLVFLTILLMGVGLVLGLTQSNKSELYLLYNEGARGTSVIEELKATRIMCAAHCMGDSRCMGFSVLKSEKICLTLSAMTSYQMIPGYKTYSLPISLRFGVNFTICGGCSLSSTADYNNWIVRCNVMPGGYIIGLNNVDNLLNIERLFCDSYSALRLNLTHGKVLLNSPTTDCITEMGTSAVMTAIWTPQDSFFQPPSFAALCREILSNHKLDAGNCTEPAPQYQNYTIYGFPETISHAVVCPDNYAAVNAYKPSDADVYNIKCCAFEEELK